MSTENYILALDQGTTSSRSIVFSKAGRIVAGAQKEIKQIYPEPGWVEQDPLEIWSSQSSTIAEVLSYSGVSPEKIRAVGVTNQRETTVVWNKHTGKPVYNAIVWQDKRTADYCRNLIANGLQDKVTEKTGLRIDPYFAGTKVRWILENVEGAREQAEKGDLLFGTVDSWLIWHLSGKTVHCTDVTNASRSLFYNLDEQAWDPELLDLFDIPECMLPEVKASSGIVAEVAKHLSPAGVPIAGIAGDQHAALFGQCCFSPGMAKSTYGTGAFLLMHMGEKRVRSQNNLLSTPAWKIGDKVEYALEGSVFMAGAAVQWLRDGLEMVRSAEELSRLAGSVSDTDGMYLVPAFAGLGAPHWDPYARGIAAGMTRGTNRAHFCRAVIESIAFQTADLIYAMEKDSGLTLKEMRVDGGASQSEPLLQFQADLLQKDVVRPQCIETTALGAAFLAGLAVDFWQSREEIQQLWKKDLTLAPKMEPSMVQQKIQGWKKAVERAKDWVDPEEETK